MGILDASKQATKHAKKMGLYFHCCLILSTADSTALPSSIQEFGRKYICCTLAYENSIASSKMIFIGNNSSLVEDHWFFVLKFCENGGLTPTPSSLFRAFRPSTIAPKSTRAWTQIRNRMHPLTWVGSLSSQWGRETEFIDSDSNILRTNAGRLML